MPLCWLWTWHWGSWGVRNCLHPVFLALVWLDEGSVFVSINLFRLFRMPCNRKRMASRSPVRATTQGSRHWAHVRLNQGGPASERWIRAEGSKRKIKRIVGNSQWQKELESQMTMIFGAGDKENVGALDRTWVLGRGLFIYFSTICFISQHWNMETY